MRSVGVAGRPDVGTTSDSDEKVVGLIGEDHDHLETGVVKVVDTADDIGSNLQPTTTPDRHRHHPSNFDILFNVNSSQLKPDPIQNYRHPTRLD
ncbi:hypothetical protein PGTUg99_021823 [Puccinia graminis f. sp. tritici]|uniref:Uncharacterized protein n=1 Tax=Puccinia graminis f. sp. tritici TaxID=56615 RepID=A0A5B0NHF4_PUCGR|nr:hypothetical protein PGTUg99_021823 [Puccinia graminis f. sp. tritici]